MASTLQFSGVVPKTHLHYVCSMSLRQPDFRTCVSSTPRLGISVKNLLKRGGGLRVSCERARVDVIEKEETEFPSLGDSEKQFTCVMKFGGSSLASADRMKEVADLILSFPNERPVIVLSAMGKTTNKLLLVYLTLFLVSLFLLFD